MTDETPDHTRPVFSVIVAIYNDWVALDRCLQALSRQTAGTKFEVIIVDDGSEDPVPETLRKWSRSYTLTVIRQAHAGVSAARNRGIQASQGSVMVFIDADCRLEPDCLAVLAVKLAELPSQDCFQLHLIGDCANAVGRAEELRLITLQNYLLRPDGYIRYLNTAGFAIRRKKISEDGNLFNPAAMRAEDTLLLASMMRRGELPVFIPDATVQHAIPLRLLSCLRKDIGSAYAERKAYGLTGGRGVSVHLTNRERLNIMASMWKTSARSSIGRVAWLIVTGRQILRLFVTVVYRLTHWPPRRPA